MNCALRLPNNYLYIKLYPTENINFSVGFILSLKLYYRYASILWRLQIMTTTQRVWYEGVAYHITARGNHRNDIFRDDEDFQYYLTVTEEALLEQLKYMGMI